MSKYELGDKDYYFNYLDLRDSFNEKNGTFNDKYYYAEKALTLVEDYITYLYQNNFLHYDTDLEKVMKSFWSQHEEEN